LKASSRKPPPTLDEVRQELAKKSYLEYCIYTHRGHWIPGKHLVYVCNLVERFINGSLANDRGEQAKILVIQMPPQHGKSQSVTETLPSYYLGKHPDRRVIEVSYGDDLARKFGRANRKKIEEFGKELFGIELDKTRKSDTDFEIAGHSGSMISRGIMAGITGQPGDLIIIDDPIKNRQEADSEVYRARLWEEWQNSIKTRLSADGKVVLIQTRWHEDDLAGRVIAHERGVYVINLPCEAEDRDPLGREAGEALFPEIGKDRAWKDAFKDSYINDPTIEGGGLRAWNALFQGRPSAQEGNMLKRHWWRYWKPKGVDLPPVMVKLPNGEYTNIHAVDLPDNFDKMLQSWDMTFKDTDGTDFVAGGIWASKGASIFFLDRVYDRMDFVQTIQAFLTLTDKWPRVLTKLVEDKANGPAVISMLRLKVRGIIPVLPEGSKVARASAVSPLMEAGNVYIPHPLICSWTNEFIDQCAAFPNGVRDDLVDQASQALKRFMYARDKAQDKPEHYNFECEKPKPRADAVTVTEDFFKGGFDL
jgi:predicted phage terminase large subunit-like protein